MSRRLAREGLRGLVTLVVGVTLCGCMTLTGQNVRYGWFEEPDRRDPWSAKIRGWQRRELLETVMAPDPQNTPAVSGSSLGRATSPDTDLRSDFEEFRAKRKRSLARDAAGWIQKQARRHYVEDGAVDHWATLEETLTRGREDCDGLELLVYNFLRELGFAEDEVFRAIVYRPSDGQHHMVTLWFEKRGDPWVIDPTGAMTTGMPRMSQVPGWVPLKIFSEDQEFSVRRNVPSPYKRRTAARLR